MNSGGERLKAGVIKKRREDHIRRVRGNITGYVDYPVIGSINIAFC